MKPQNLKAQASKQAAIFDQLVHAVGKKNVMQYNISVVMAHTLKRDSSDGLPANSDVRPRPAFVFTALKLL
jgi:hypothetical protein